MSTVNTMSRLAAILSLLVVSVQANNAIPQHYFWDDQGRAAANAAAPMWHFASGSCLPSAAEDGTYQTNGVNADTAQMCVVGANQGKGCPGDNSYRGKNVWYAHVDGEPFADIPTYFKTVQCSFDEWRVYYGVYFKKDTWHKSDWEYAVVKWRRQAEDVWVRDSISLEVDGKRGGGGWGSIPSTFDGSNDQWDDGNRNRDHPKLYFSKHHHAVHWDTSNDFKSTCPPSGDIYTNDFRAADFQFWSTSHLRHVDYVHPDWSYGKASNPHSTINELCNRF